MRKLLVFQHSAREPLGILDPMLRAAGFRVRYVNFARHPDTLPDVSRYHGLIVLGGPMNVDQQDRFAHLSVEIDAIREALRRDMPVLGICLGAQLLAAALGASVRPNPVREIGWYRLHPTAAAISTAVSMYFSGMPTPSICPTAPSIWRARRPVPIRRSATASAPMDCSFTSKPIRN
jgi:GMP synthase (glutamine-hydrolysing)